MNTKILRNITSALKAVLPAILLAASFSSADAAVTKDFFASSSPLASGKWVKVGVGETGVYEISFDKLREMGFSNPESVAVFGNGGKALPESFVTNSGALTFKDELKQVPTFIDGNKLFFYGLGPEEISFVASSDYSTGGYFSRDSRNIYTFRSYYFITDSKPALQMQSAGFDAASAPTLTDGLSFVYHELDSVQNNTQAGQLFWGERMGKPGLSRRTWPVSLPGAVSKSNGVMQCHMYFDDKLEFITSTISFGFEGSGNTVSSTRFTLTSPAFYQPFKTQLAQITIPGTSGTVYTEMKGDLDMGSFSNLDFWVVTYPCSTAGLNTSSNTFTQQLFALPGVKEGASAKFGLNNSSTLAAFDVTDPHNPKIVPLSSEGGSLYAGVSNSGATPLLAVFDKAKTQNQIGCFGGEAFSVVENQDLRKYKDTGTDFIIISTPRYLSYAEEIADLHRTRDGIDVLVLTPEQIYNDFSSGRPDPMAIRSFAKMLYFSDRKPKNMLLVGPIFGDFRGLNGEHDPWESHIAFQSPQVSVKNGAFNINDFYGMMDDLFRTDYYETNSVQIGVALLPFLSEADAAITVEKIKNYMDRTDWAYYLNRYTAVGGVGDSHTHDFQVRDINAHVRQLDNNGTIVTPLSIDAYGTSEAYKKFISKLNEGCSIFTYFGHGGPSTLGKDNLFFNSSDISKLRNKVLPLAGFGGCQLTNTDRGYRGLGEEIVTATPYGAIGSIVSARETWSAQNAEFFKQFFISLYREGTRVTSPVRQKPATIGEVYADVKNYSTYNNELAYQLICDPALVIPAINRGINADALLSSTITPGEAFTVSGYVKTVDGKKDSGYNGQVVVRVMEPERSIPGGNVVSGDDVGALSYFLRDTQITMGVAEVKDGEFSLSIYAPASMKAFTGSNALVYVCAYDPSVRTGAGQCFSVAVGDASSSAAEEADTQAPVIEDFSVSTENNTLSIVVSDNVALNMSFSTFNKGMTLFIDGKEFSDIHFVEPEIDPDRMAFRKSVPLESLEYGHHVAVLRVKDLAGNAAEREISFSLLPPAPKFSLTIDPALSSAAVTAFKAEGEIPANAVLYVVTLAGSPVWNGPFSGASCTWNHTDSTGYKVTPGHYKAFILEEGTNAVNGHSDAIDVPVI
ncbi:MAG: hypothetical protein J1E97_05540 [Muribaculaceae bacterium]|nr:hypothetical protein [Muribaculaceae bacterium]